MMHSLCNNECKYFSLLNLVFFFGFIMNCAHNIERSGSFNKNHGENSPFSGLCSFKNRHIREAVVSNDVENNLSIRMPEEIRQLCLYCFVGMRMPPGNTTLVTD